MRKKSKKIRIFEVSGKSHSAENVSAFGVLWTSILFQNRTKMKRDPLETLKNCEKSHKAEKKFRSRAKLEPTSFYLAALKKSEAEAALVWPLMEASL